jgi:tetratricopeptide (TPR) repeat protein
MQMNLDMRWQAFKWRAFAYIALGMRTRAADDFEEMLLAYPNDPYVLSSLAYLKTEMGDKPGAIAMYKKVVLGASAGAQDWYNLGFLQEELGQIDDAEISMRKAIALDEKLDQAWYGLGLVLIQQNRLDEALTVLKKNTQLQPMSPYAWYQMARVYVDNQQPDKALKIITHLKGFEPKFAAQLERETGLTG